MELHGWQQCQRKRDATVGTLSLLPPSWDTISAIYHEVVKFVSKFPYQKRLVLYFAYRGTTIKLDLGDVKAAGAVCILGLGVGLGTLFIYRLYRQYIRPFLDRFDKSDTDQSTPSDCSLFVDSSDSAVDGAMGNNSSGKAPSVYYSPEYGVAFGGKGQPPQRQPQSAVDSVRMRRVGTRQKPVRRQSANRDIAGGVGPNLNPLYYEDSIRDSFYSTAESGFETLPECNEDEENDEDRGLSQSLKDNFSVSSLRERNERYFSTSIAGHTNSSGDVRTVVCEMVGQGNEQGSTPSLTTQHTGHAHCSPVKSAKSSPQHVAAGKATDSPHYLSVKRPHGYPNSDEFDYDPSLDASESIRSFNSSAEDWSWEDEERDCMSPLPHTHSAMSDSQFRQSLMQRIREWSNFAEEYGKSRSPTPDCASPPRYIRRSRSLDRHLGEPVFVPEVDVAPSEPIKVEDTTTKNLECLETELHDIQGEFESITSKLHELIERGNKDEPQQQEAKSSPSHQPHLHHPPHHHSRPPQANSARFKSRTKWERLPNLARSDSNRSSRASSVEFSWDCGEVGASGDGGEDGAQADGVREDQLATDQSGDGSQLTTDGQVFTEDSPPADAVVSIGEAVSIVEYADMEWKGQTEKAETIKKGYHSISDLFLCDRLRCIRGDNYCALRSTLYQVLTAGHRVTHRWPGLISIVDRLHTLNANPASGLEHWSFGNRFRWKGEEDKFSLICKCVLSLYAVIEEISAMSTVEEREARTLSILNSSESFDAQLMEGMKLMMLFRVSDLQREMAEGMDMPTFAWLLFARDTSETVVDFVKNHLNCVGDSAGVDQVEMCLLGHCLGVKLRVARLDHYGQQEFDVSFPDEAPDDWPSICLLAEDDRHYNVPVP